MTFLLALLLWFVITSIIINAAENQILVFIALQVLIFLASLKIVEAFF